MDNNNRIEDSELNTGGVITRQRRKKMEKHGKNEKKNTRQSRRRGVQHKEKKIKANDEEPLHNDNDIQSSSDEEYILSEESEIDTISETSIDEEELIELEKLMEEAELEEKEERKQMSETTEEGGWETTEEIEVDTEGNEIENKIKRKNTVTLESQENALKRHINQLLSGNSSKNMQPHIEVYIPGEENEIEELRKKEKRKLKKYFDTLDEEKKKKFKEIEKALKEKNNSDIPIYYRILDMDISLDSKDTILKYVESLQMIDESSTDYTKIKSFVDTCIEIPFGKYITLPKPENFSEFLVDSCNKLDECTYGHKGPKMEIIQYLCQLIKNPECKGQPLGICGPPGIGKTTLIKDGLANVLGRPFYFISLGGCSDSSYLDGHSFTYEGSKTGKIVDILRSANCMNPIFYFDELDKISETSKGDEISNLLVHLTDESQNSHFSDKYLHGIDIDLSKAFFVFSFNHLEKVNPILRDRINILNLDDFKTPEKVNIATNYLIPKIKKEFSIESDKYMLKDEQILKLMTQFIGENETGVRSLKKLLIKLYSKINMLRLGEGSESVLKIMGLKQKDWDNFTIDSNEITDTIIQKLLQNENGSINAREKLMLQSLYT